jgi:hypothetical protein
LYRRRTGGRVTGFTRDCDRALGLAPDHHDLGALAGELDRCCASFPRVAPVVRTRVTAATLLSADHDPGLTLINLVNKDWSDDHRDEPVLERGIQSDMPITLHRTAEITVGLPREQAIALFTAEGERRWVEGWEPRYPGTGPTRRTRSRVHHCARPR